MSQKQYTFQDIIKTLKEDEAYVEIIRLGSYDDIDDKFSDVVKYAVLILDKTTKSVPKLVVLENGLQLENSGFNYYSSHTSGKNKNAIDEISYLYYWLPIVENLKNVKTVYLAPDGVYNKMNLDVLYNPTSGLYVSDEINIKLLSSGRDLLKNLIQ